jgi:hypothetical protein
VGQALWHPQKIHEKSRNLDLEEREISQIFIKITGVVHFGMLNTVLTLEDQNSSALVISHSKLKF